MTVDEAKQLVAEIVCQLNLAEAREIAEWLTEKLDGASGAPEFIN